MSGNPNNSREISRSSCGVINYRAEYGRSMRRRSCRILSCLLEPGGQRCANAVLHDDRAVAGLLVRVRVLEPQCQPGEHPVRERYLATVALGVEVGLASADMRLLVLAPVGAPEGADQGRDRIGEREGDPLRLDQAEVLAQRER